MTELTSKEKEYLDMVFYLRHKLPRILFDAQAAEMEAKLNEILFDISVPIDSDKVTELLTVFNEFDKARVELEKLNENRFLGYAGPITKEGDAEMIPLGELVVCKKKNEHAPGDIFRTGTKLQRQGQRCPIHGEFMVRKTKKE
jgi:hypothetical protein